MLKFIITRSSFLFLLTCCSFQLNAQTYIGFRGGINVGGVSTTMNGAITKDKILGFNAALYFDFGIGNNMAIQPEVSFVQKGFRRYLGETNDWYYKLNYFEFASLFKYKFKKKVSNERKRKKTFGYCIVGPYIGKATSASLKNHYDDEKKDYNFMSGIILNRGDLGIMIGGGLELQLNNGNLVIDLRYSQGLVEINCCSSSNGDIRNQGILVSVGYAFQIGNKKR